MRLTVFKSNRSSNKLRRIFINGIRPCLALLITVLLAFAPTMQAYSLKCYGRLLDIEHGKDSITLCRGQKLRLHVTSAETGLPILKGLRFYSSRPSVATVSATSGNVSAGRVGSAVITVTDARGRTGSIVIKVTYRKRHTAYAPIAALAAAAAFSSLLKHLHK